MVPGHVLVERLARYAEFTDIENETFCENMKATDVDDNNNISLLEGNTSGMCYDGSVSVPRSISPENSDLERPSKRLRFS